MASTSLEWKRHLQTSYKSWITSNSGSWPKNRGLKLLQSRWPRKNRTRLPKLPYYSGLGVLMLLWDWKVLLATVMGIGTVLVLPTLQRYSWQPVVQKLYQFWCSPNRTLVVSVVGGGLVAALTYACAQIWIETQSHWLATGLILEGILLVVLVGMGMTIGFSQYAGNSDAILYQGLSDLTQPEPVTRLVAIHRLVDLARKNRLNAAQVHLLYDAFTLHLHQESEGQVRNAVLQGLAVLQA